MFVQFFDLKYPFCRVDSCWNAANWYVDKNVCNSVSYCPWYRCIFLYLVQNIIYFEFVILFKNNLNFFRNMIVILFAWVKYNLDYIFKLSIISHSYLLFLCYISYSSINVLLHRISRSNAHVHYRPWTSVFRQKFNNISNFFAHHSIANSINFDFHFH